MKSNLFCLFSLFVASLFAIWAFSMGGADVLSPEFVWADFVFWGIITVGAIPASIELVREEYRALGNWVRTVVRGNTDGLTEVVTPFRKEVHNCKSKTTLPLSHAKQTTTPNELRGAA